MGSDCTTEPIGTTEKKLKTIASQINLEGMDVFTYADWQDFIILSGIGRSNETAKTWLRVALAHKMVQCTAGFKGAPGSRYAKGVNWAKFTDGGVV